MMQYADVFKKKKNLLTALLPYSLCCGLCVVGICFPVSVWVSSLLQLENMQIRLTGHS